MRKLLGPAARLRALLLFEWLEVDLLLKFLHTSHEYITLSNAFFAEKMRDNFTGNGNRCTWLCFLLSWKIEGKRYFRNRIKIKIKAGYFRSIAEDNLSSSRTPTEHRCNISPWNATSILHILFVCLFICIAFFHWFIWFNFSFFSRFCA